MKKQQEIVDFWIKNHGVRYFDELTNMVLLYEELGELSRHMSRVFGEQSYKSGEEKEKSKEKITEEMADVLFVLICLANQMEINLETSLEESIQKKTLRDGSRHKENIKLKK